MAQKKPNYHQTPQHYLRGFCEPGTSFIWAFERGRSFFPGIKAGKDNPARRGLKTIGIRPDAYAARAPDGRIHYCYEADLQRIEIQATATINKIRAFERIDSSEKDVLARYILTMVKRRTPRDARMLPQFKAATAEVVETARHEMRKAALNGEFTKALQKRSEADYWELNGDAWFSRESMVKSVGLAQRELTRPLWEFVKAAPGDYFVTTDNPVGNAGFRTTLVFPVSQDVVLTYALQGNDLTYREASPEETRQKNALIISQAEQEVYSPRPDQWIHVGWAEGFSFYAE